MKYNIPKEISTEMKLSDKIFLKDLIITIIALFVASLFNGFVYRPLIVVYYIFVFLSTVYLVNRSINNPKKRVFQSIYLALRRDRTTYVAE
ncbi:DUF5592 family protein [Clostridium perfringens]|uniref:DUF5592 family protein n=1 Tax=Clostridium perfringens TaxID=1502 RepID=UPI0007769757|nr:DUF5592 family protein [Clostridium perfringens]AMN30815.1 hypothetical protein JFP55_pH0027 [Clostridium perfringens]EIF6165909.1 hypothetical protein [Clostridium perfringens]MDM0935699.1 DUF5592 family protein [Clostridium perfringens]PWX46989.1 hypothetical protein CYK61_14250 [Clostridium perfringens]HAT4117281.1 hypothetical protein [Clostridium perfringens]